MVTRRISYRPTWTYDLTAPVNGERSAFCEKRESADRLIRAAPGGGRGEGLPSPR